MAEPHLLESAPGPAEACILVAEDDPINQEVIAGQLRLLGYRFCLANDGQQALALWRQGGFELVLTDLHMPGLDGYDLARAVREDCARQGRAAPPLLMLSGDAVADETERARAAGIDLYLVKPVGLQALRDALAPWLPAPSAPAPAEDWLQTEVLWQMVGGDPAEAHAVLADFLPAAEGLASELRQALRGGDLQHAGTLAHKLQSAARAVGALPLADGCAALQRQRERGEALQVELALQAFDTLVHNTLHRVQQMLENPHAH